MSDEDEWAYLRRVAAARAAVEEGTAMLKVEVRCARRRHLAASVYRTREGLFWEPKTGYRPSREGHRAVLADVKPKLVPEGHLGKGTVIPAGCFISDLAEEEVLRFGCDCHTGSLTARELRMAAGGRRHRVVLFGAARDVLASD